MKQTKNKKGAPLKLGPEVEANNGNGINFAIGESKWTASLEGHMELPVMLSVCESENASSLTYLNYNFYQLEELILKLKEILEQTPKQVRPPSSLVTPRQAPERGIKAG